MSEVQRITVLWPVGPHGYGNYPVVLASDFDTERLRSETAEAELAALREELAEVSGTLEFNTNCWARERAVMIDKNQTLTADLLACGRHRKADEQRNAECITLLRRSRAADGQDPSTWWNDRALILQAALAKPTESGASE